MAKRDKYELAETLLKIIKRLAEGEKLTYRQVAKEYGVEVPAAGNYLRFARRHLPILKRLRGGLAVYQAAGTSESAFERALALELAIESAPWLNETRYGAHLRELASTFRESVSPSDGETLSRILAAFHVKRRALPSTSSDAQNIEALLDAIRQRRRCRIRYRKLGAGWSEYEVEPWCLNVVSDSMFLLAAKCPDGDTRSFEMSDVASVKILQETFKLPPRHRADVRSMLGDSVGSYAKGYADPVAVRLEARGQAATLLRRRPLHVSQHVEECADGSSIVQLRAMVCPDLVSAVLALLPDIRVLTPPELVQAVRSAAMAAAPDP